MYKFLYNRQCNEDNNMSGVSGLAASVMQSQWSATSSAAATPHPFRGETGGVGTRLESVVSAPGHLTLSPDQA